MKLLPTLALIVAGVYVFSKLTTAGVASRLNLIISGMNLQLQGIVPVVNLQVTAQNVTNEALQFNAITANALLNGTPIGNVTGFTPVAIPAVSQATIPLQIMVNAPALTADVVNILSGGAGVSANIELQGTANISGLLLPIDVTYKAI